MCFYLRWLRSFTCGDQLLTYRFRRMGLKVLVLSLASLSLPSPAGKVDGDWSEMRRNTRLVTLGYNSVCRIAFHVQGLIMLVDIVWSVRNECSSPETPSHFWGALMTLGG